MGRRIEQTNELLRAELAELVNRELQFDGLITVSYVDCSPDLSQAKIGVSVLPENKFGTALKLLKKSSSSFSGALRRKLKLKFIPKFKWEADTREKRAAEIDEILRSG